MSEAVEASIHSVSHSSASQPEKVEINAYGVAISDNAGKIGSKIGKLVRIHVPISYESWDKVPGKCKDDVWDELRKFYDVESDAKELYLKKMCVSFRRYKSELRTNYYDKFDNDEDRRKNCPPKVSLEDWDGFLKNEAKPGAHERRELGKKNRSVYNYSHHSGRTSHAVVEHKMASENPEKEITRRLVWEKTHTKKDGTISDSNSSYFGKIAKAKETINDDEEEDLTLDEDILSQVFGKDKKGRTRSVGSMISKSQVKASTISRKQLKKIKSGSDNLTARIEKVEGTLENVEGTLKSIFGMLKGYVNRENQIPDIDSNEGGSVGTHQENRGRTSNTDVVANPLISHVSTNKKCEMLNFDLEVVATGLVCTDSTASIIHGKPVPPTHEKVIVDNILLPDEATAKQNHPLATTFGDVGVGGYVSHPKSSIRYL